MMLRHYLEEMFEPTLLYGFSLSVIGVAAAYYYGVFSPFYAVLVVLGSVLAQMSVNVISDYFDYRSGLDRELARKKSNSISGGSSLVADGLIKPGEALAIGLGTFTAAAIIGLYLLYMRPVILPIVIVAASSILLYAKYAKRVPYLSEPLCAFNYTLIPLGSFVVIAGASLLLHGVLAAFIPAGILLGSNALFVNEVPDRHIDRKYGVRHAAVMLRTNRGIGLYYITTQCSAFLVMAVGAALRLLPLLSIASLVVIPATIYVFRGLYNGDSRRYGKYLGVHTIAALAFALILSASYVIGI